MEYPRSPDRKNNQSPYEELGEANNRDIHLDIPASAVPNFVTPVKQPIPFYTGKGQTPLTPPTPSSLLPISYESAWRRCLRITLLIFEFICMVGVLLFLILRFLGYLSLEYSILSTLVDVRDPTITYTVVTRPQIMFFFYKKSLVNATTGINVTMQNYIEKVNLTEKCDGEFEYYPSQGAADILDASFTGIFVKATMCLDMFIILLCAIIKLLMSRYVKENDIPMMLKLRMKSKFAYEMTLYTLLNVVIISFVGILIPLFTLDYDNNCLISTVGYTVDGLYKGYYGLMICFICFLIPLLFFVLYTYVEDEMKYFCFGLFWIMLPAFLLVVATGHAILILTFRETKDMMVSGVVIGCYTLLLISCIITGTVSVVEWLDFGTKKAAAERRELRVFPATASGSGGFKAPYSPA